MRMLSKSFNCILQNCVCALSIIAEIAFRKEGFFQERGAESHAGSLQHPSRQPGVDSYTGHVQALPALQEWAGQVHGAYVSYPAAAAD